MHHAARLAAVALLLVLAGPAGTVTAAPGPPPDPSYCRVVATVLLPDSTQQDYVTHSPGKLLGWQCEQEAQRAAEHGFRLVDFNTGRVFYFPAHRVLLLEIRQLR